MPPSVAPAQASTQRWGTAGEFSSTTSKRPRPVYCSSTRQGRTRAPPQYRPIAGVVTDLTSCTISAATLSNFSVTVGGTSLLSSGKSAARWVGAVAQRIGGQADSLTGYDPNRAYPLLTDTPRLSNSSTARHDHFFGGVGTDGGG
jgi:hypothetical protein